MRCAVFGDRVDVTGDSHGISLSPCLLGQYMPMDQDQGGAAVSSGARRERDGWDKQAAIPGEIAGW